jgi:hypothetical protein
MELVAVDPVLQILSKVCNFFASSKLLYLHILLGAAKLDAAVTGCFKKYAPRL